MPVIFLKMALKEDFELKPESSANVTKVYFSASEELSSSFIYVMR